MSCTTTAKSGLLLVATLVIRPFLVAARLRDIGLNPWFSILIFVPVVALVVGLVCVFVPTWSAYGSGWLNRLPKWKEPVVTDSKKCSAVLF